MPVWKWTLAHEKRQIAAIQVRSAGKLAGERTTVVRVLESKPQDRWPFGRRDVGS